MGTADHRLSTNHRADDRCIVTYCGASFCISFCLPQGTVRCDDVPAACISVPIPILLSTSFLLLLPAMRASPGPRRPGDLTVGSSRGPPDSTFSRKSLAVYSVQYRMGMREQRMKRRRRSSTLRSLCPSARIIYDVFRQRRAQRFRVPPQFLLSCILMWVILKGPMVPCLKKEAD